MLTVCTFKWHTPGYRGQFNNSHVRVLQNMVARHYRKPHRFVCFTDQPKGLEDIAVPMWNDYRTVPNPTGGGRPSCYLRLKLYSKEMREILGDRFVNLDLDTVICGDVAPLWDRPEEIVLWRDATQTWPYNGSMVLMTPGVRQQVWDDFDPIESPKITTAVGYRGSDQAWISYKLGWNEANWSAKDGVLYYNKMENRKVLPNGARIVFTTASTPPWTLRHPWVREHYQ